MAECQTIYELVRQMKEDDELGQVNTSEFVKFNLREDINKIEAYLNSKHTSGDTDAQGREKPFKNIVNSAVNIVYRATDLDCKNIKLYATKEKDFVLSMLMTIKLHEWTNEVEFGKFLNIWGLALAKYLEVFVKIVEKDGELFFNVVPWDRLIVDPINPEDSPKIEKIDYTPAQLRKQKGYDKKMVEELIENQTTRKVMGNSGIEKDAKSNFITVYEIHGELPLSYLTGKEKDEDEYVQQMHIISFNATENDKEEYNDYTLFSGREAKSPYVLTSLLPSETGTLTLNGAVKNLFEAQWMVNDNEKKIKDQLDLASKLFFQTSDGNFVGQNATTSLDNGDILVHAINQPLTQLNNRPDIAAMQSSQGSWQAQGNQINNISDAMTGANPPSGTAWRLQQAVLQESHSLFELYAENKGLFVKMMFREYVLPHFKKKLNNTKEISAILEDHQIKLLDMRYVPNEAIRRVNQKIKDTVLSGEIYDPTMQSGQIAETEQQLKTELSQLGNQRFIKPSDISTETWKEIFQDVETKLEIDVTGEAKDIQGTLTTMSTILQTIASNPMVLQDPNARMIFNRIIELSGGISPIEFQTAQVQPAPAMAGQVGGAVPAQVNPNQ